MNRILKICALVSSAVLLFTAAGCKNSYQDAIIYFEAPEKPSTVDAQTASTDSELIIVKNIYEGLLRQNASGAVVCGATESFSADNLTYTFKLRRDAVWSNDEPVTANDFVFGLRRAVSPETKSPFASRLFCIENARDIYGGKKSSDTLGVSAPDDYTVIIKLSEQDDGFEKTLTTSVAMPCNENFFNEAAGKYGLSSEYTISNGSYRLSKWNKEAFGIRLYSNEKYTGTLTAKNSAVFITNDDEETAADKLIKNSVDIAFIDSSQSGTVENGGLKTLNFENICWVMTINSDFSSDLRKSLAMLVGSEVFGNDLQSGYSPADSLYPAAVNQNATSSGMTFYNLPSAKELFSKETAKLPDKKFPSSVRLYYYDNGVIKPIVTDIVGHWQNNLGAFVNIETADSGEELLSQLTNQTLSMAVFPVKADSGIISEYLKKFGVNYNGESADSIQTALLKNNHIIPIAFQNTTIAYSTALSDLFVQSGDWYPDFSFIVKTE